MRHPDSQVDNEENSGNLKPTSRTPRQNDGLERVQGHAQTTEQSGKECGDVHMRLLPPLDVGELSQPYQRPVSLTSWSWLRL